MGLWWVLPFFCLFVFHFFAFLSCFASLILLWFFFMSSLLRPEKVFPRICLAKFWAKFGWTFLGWIPTKVTKPLILWMEGPDCSENSWEDFGWFLAIERFFGPQDFLHWLRQIAPDYRKRGEFHSDSVCTNPILEAPCFASTNLGVSRETVSRQWPPLQILAVKKSFFLFFANFGWWNIFRKVPVRYLNGMRGA